ncbi:hypothetical protein BH11PSE7_BH11PSE7_13450 [soil metagenome]
MKASLPAVAVLSMMCLAGPMAGAQTVYRCGSSYSQSPCPAGVAVAVDDPRSAQQKQETEAAARHDSKTADGMEKSRLKQEAMDRPAQLAAARAAQKAATQKPEKTPAPKKQARKKDKHKETDAPVYTGGKKDDVAIKSPKHSKASKKKSA